MSAPVEKVRTADLLARLRRHYIKPGPFPGGVFIPECGQNGVGNGQRCDALYVGFTSSSGRILVGHELKVSRADWLHELAQVDKADRWADECHAWYVVAPSTEIVKREELPHGWGLMVINPRTTTRLDVVVKAVVHEDRVPAWWAVRSIMARLDTLQHADRADHRQKLDREYREKLDAAKGELRAQGVSNDPQVARLVAVLARVKAEGGEEFRFQGVSDDDMVAVLIDATKARQAATALRWDMQRIVRDVQTLAKPFADAYGELAELASEAESLAASGLGTK